MCLVAAGNGFEAIEEPLPAKGTASERPLVVGPCPLLAALPTRGEEKTMSHDEHPARPPNEEEDEVARRASEAPRQPAIPRMPSHRSLAEIARSDHVTMREEQRLGQPADQPHPGKDRQRRRNRQPRRDLQIARRQLAQLPIGQQLHRVDHREGDGRRAREHRLRQAQRQV